MEDCYEKRNLFKYERFRCFGKFFFKCITSHSINSEGVDYTTACYIKHLEPNNIDYPLKFS